MTDFLAELAALAEKATPGPWHTWHTADLDQGMQIWSNVHQYIGTTRDYAGDDAALIVLLRNSIPAILTMGRERDALRKYVVLALEALDSAQELNPSNYDHDQVCELNTAFVEVYGLLRQALEGGN